MNRRMFRQVLDCGDGVREVTALAVAAHKIPYCPANSADTTTPPKAATPKTQSKTLARQFAPQSVHGRKCAVDKPWKPPMDRIAVTPTFQSVCLARWKTGTTKLDGFMASLRVQVGGRRFL